MKNKASLNEKKMKEERGMKNKVFKKLGTVTVVALVILLLAVLSVTVGAEEAYLIEYDTPTKVWTDSSKPGSQMSYDKDTKTLTLENWTIDGTLKIKTYDNSTGIFTIILKGNNVINGGVFGIDFSGHNETVLRITSETPETAGTLTINPGPATAERYSAGIYTLYAKVQILNGVTVNTYGSEVTDYFGTSAGVYASGGLRVFDATLNAYGGACPDNNTYGIIAIQNSVSIQDATVTAIGGNEGNSMGIYTYIYADVDINNSTVFAKGGDTDKSSAGIQISGGDLTIWANSHVTAIGGNVNGSYSTSKGISTTGKVYSSYTNSTLTAIGGSATKESIGIYSEKSSTFSGKCTIIATPGASNISQGYYCKENSDYEYYKTLDYSVRNDQGEEQSALTISGIPTSVALGDEFTLSVTGGSGSGVYFWTTSNPDVATIDQNGKVKVLGKGVATITAKKAADPTYKEASATYEIDIHAHEFSYSANGNELIATCTKSGCDLENASGGSVKVVAPDNLAYDGTDKNANLVYNSWQSEEDVRIEYNSVSRIGVTGKEIVASITVGGVSASVGYVITYADISSATVEIDSNADLTYNGAEIKPNVTVTFNGETLSSGYYTVIYSNNVNVTEEGATVTVTGRGNYRGSASAKFDIIKADPIFQAPTPRENLVYNADTQKLANPGSAGTGGNGALTIVYSLEENGEYNGQIPSAKNAGEYKVWYYAEGNSNYNGIEKNYFEGKIAKAPLTVTALDRTITYGDAPVHNSVKYSGIASMSDSLEIVNNIVFVYTYERYGDVGEYEIIPTNIINDNYEVTVINGVLTVLPRTLTVEADEKTKIYGEADPELTYKANGLVNGDTLDGKLEREAGETVGEYRILQGTLGNDNYEITYNSSTFGIEKKELTVSVKDNSITYGDAPANIGLLYDGFIMGEDESVLYGEPAYTYEYEQYGNVGSYGISVSGLEADNYIIAYEKGTLTVLPKAITVTADAKEKTYGDSDPELTYVAEGLVNGDTLDGALTREAGETVGEYRILQGTLENGNYDITYIGSTLSVGKRALRVSAKNLSVEQYYDIPKYTYVAEGFVNGDGFITEPTFNAPSTSLISSGVYDIVLFGADAGDNYDITYENGRLVIVAHITHKGGIATCTSKPVCTVCGKGYASSLGHIWSDGEETKAPTCSSTGEITYICERDGSHKKTEAVSELAHTERVIEGKAATCEERGLTDGSECSVCGELLVAQMPIPALGHSEIAIPDKAATCEESGLLGGTECSVCGEVLKEQKIVPARGHSAIKLTGKAPTCSEAGLTDGKACWRCDEILEAQSEIEKLAHTYDNACDSDCSVCSEKRSVPSHSDSDKDRVCDVCESKLARQGLSGGAIALIVIGSVIAVGGIGFVVFRFVIKKKD